ncbi:MAG: FtsX-like permease family protein [Candidatus Limnocylindrales bacterium]
MTRLGLRLALAGGRGAVVGLVLTAVAVAVGTAVLLFALSFLPALADRDARTAWRETFLLDDDATSSLLILPVEDHVGDRVLTRVVVAPTGGGDLALPVGLPALPGPGEAYVSPALAQLLAERPADELEPRVGRVMGELGESMLASPDELVVVIGMDAEALRADTGVAVRAFATESTPLDLSPIALLLIVLAAAGALAPVAVFVSTATRMSAARRELRLAALRLVGATPAQVARLAVVEALVSTVLGAAGGIVLFIALRPLVARIPLDDATWWPAAIVPPPGPALALLVTVQVVGAAGALLAMRRLTITPLGVQRRSVPRPPGAWRVLPVVASIVALFAAIGLYEGGGDVPSAISLGGAGIAFLGVILGIAFAGPWLTLVVGRALHRVARGGSSLLAARRLVDEPRSSFGAIAGVIMAVFIASAFFTFSAYTQTRAGSAMDLLLPSGGVVAWLGGARPVTDALTDQLRVLPGVTAAVPIREVSLVRGEEVAGSGWVVTCADLRAVLARGAAIECAPKGISRANTTATLDGTFVMRTDRDLVGGPLPGIGLDLAGGLPPSATQPDPETVGFLPDLVIDRSILAPDALASLSVTRVYVATDGSAAVIDRVRSVVMAARPGSFVVAQAQPLAANHQFEEIGRIVAMGLVATLALAGCSLAVAVTTSTLERRRQFVFLRSAGMAAASLRATILLQAAVPLAAVATLSAVLGAVVGSGILLVAAQVVTVPDGSLIGVVLLSVAVAMGVVLLTLPPLERMTRPTSLRHE